MDISKIESTLSLLTNSISQMMLSMIITPDGLTLAYEGKVDDAENVGALCIELQLVCDKIMLQLEGGALKEIFIRSENHCVIILPIKDKGILACMTTTDVNSRIMTTIAWKAILQLEDVI